MPDIMRIIAWLVLFVFYWMISLALKPDVENVTYPPVFIPEHPTFDNFVQVFQKSPFGLYTLNSFVVAAAFLGVPTLAAIGAGALIGAIALGRERPTSRETSVG